MTSLNEKDAELMHSCRLKGLMKQYPQPEDGFSRCSRVYDETIAGTPTRSGGGGGRGFHEDLKSTLAQNGQQPHRRVNTNERKTIVSYRQKRNKVVAERSLIVHLNCPRAGESP